MVYYLCWGYATVVYIYSWLLLLKLMVGGNCELQPRGHLSIGSHFFGESMWAVVERFDFFYVQEIGYRGKQRGDDDIS